MARYPNRKALNEGLDEFNIFKQGFLVRFSTPAECYVYRKYYTQVPHSSGVLCVNVPYTAFC